MIDAVNSIGILELAQNGICAKQAEEPGGILRFFAAQVGRSYAMVFMIVAELR